jgi:glycogen operon protein
MTDSDWSTGWTRSITAYFDGTRDADRDQRGRPMLDDDLLLVVNGWWEPLTFTVPDVDSPREWRSEVDSYAGVAGPAAGAALAPGATLSVGPRSIILLSSARPRPGLVRAGAAVARRRRPRGRSADQPANS